MTFEMDSSSDHLEGLGFGHNVFLSHCA